MILMVKVFPGVLLSIQKMNGFFEYKADGTTWNTTDQQKARLVVMEKADKFGDF